MTKLVNEQVFLLDMDGVLANFVQGVIDSHVLGVGHHEWDSWNFHNTLGISDSKMWGIASSQDWWLNLQPYEWASTLVSKLKELGSVIYCTSPSVHSDCPRQKIDWLRKHGLMGQTNDYQIGPRKELLAKSGAILIDDYDVNVNKFVTAGGHAVLFPQPWNANKLYIGCKIEYTLNQIDEILNLTKVQNGTLTKSCQKTKTSCCRSKGSTC